MFINLDLRDGDSLILQRLKVTDCYVFNKAKDLYFLL